MDRDVTFETGTLRRFLSAPTQLSSLPFYNPLRVLACVSRCKNQNCFVNLNTQAAPVLLKPVVLNWQGKGRSSLHPGDACRPDEPGAHYRRYQSLEFHRLNLKQPTLE